MECTLDFAYNQIYIQMVQEFMKKTKVVYTILLIITVLFGAVVGGLGLIMGYCATRLDIWGATPTFALGTDPNLNFSIEYGPLTYNGFLYDIRVELDVNMYNESIDGSNIGNGSTTFLLSPGVPTSLDLTVVLYNTTDFSSAIAQFRIRAVVVLMGFDWLGIDITVLFNATDLSP